MAKKLTNKELMQLTIDEEVEKAIIWGINNKDNLDLYTVGLLGGHLVLKPMKEILEMYKKENNL